MAPPSAGGWRPGRGCRRRSGRRRAGDLAPPSICRKTSRPPAPPRCAAPPTPRLDRPEEALEFYEEAARLATEPAAVGWARLGAAWAHVEAGRSEDAMRMLDGLTDHVDPEVAMQAALTMARVHSDAEDWDAVLGALEGVEAKGLGPGWDASVVETRAAALAASS